MIRPLLLACVGCFLLAPGPAAAAGAEQPPIRKAGLWEIKMVRTGSPVPDITMQHCTNETIDRQMNGMAGPRGAAELLQAGHPQDGDRLRVRHGLQHRGPIDHIAFRRGRRFQFRLHGHHRVAQRGRPGAARDTTSKIEAKWVGPCKPDQKPGDIMMPGGRKMNVMEMPNLRSGQPTR